MYSMLLRRYTIQYEPDYDTGTAILHHVWIEDEETDSVVDMLPQLLGAKEATLAREVWTQHRLNELDR